MGEFGKRALNKARTRLDILNAVYDLCDAVTFRDLKVKSVVEKVNITEMTFFNYFAKKEEILKYMMGLWALDLMVLQHRNPLTGEAAIHRIFQRTAKQVKAHHGLMVSFLSYLVTSEIDPSANDIEAADRYLLYPDIPELFESKIPSGNELLMQHLFEINSSIDHTQTLLRLASCFYGDVLISHTANLDLDMLYSNSLDLILRDI